ncbi:MAG: hypothetical protein ACI9TV_000541, partial [Sulfurimonas sp.]|uniref:hypothetical protein n=1 Tax=Sulfurimonas sp. TaxID=2022749 RepID=UPI0039E4CD91
TSFNNDFKWANDKKPKDFQEIEIFFDKDEYLPAIALYSDEKTLIIEHMNQENEKVYFEDMDFVNIAQEVAYSLLNDKYERFSVEVTNETILIVPSTIEPIIRDREKVREALVKRKEERKKLTGI